MNINMDEEMLAYQLRKTEQSRPSGMKWFIIIALGVFIGNAASFGLERAVLYWELNQIAVAVTTAMEESSRNMAVQSAEQRKIREAQSKQRQIQLQNKQDGLRQATATCNFWNQQLAKDNTSQNRMHRDQACNMVNQFR